MFFYGTIACEYETWPGLVLQIKCVFMHRKMGMNMHIKMNLTNFALWQINLNAFHKCIYYLNIYLFAFFMYLKMNLNAFEKKLHIKITFESRHKSVLICTS